MKLTIPRRIKPGAMVAYGSLAAGVGVALGAFAAHGLRATLSPEAVTTFETGVRYQMYHSFGLIAAGLAEKFWGAERPGAFLSAAWLFGAGILLFCGSLYVLSLGGASWFGFVTPLGGICFIVGWFVLYMTVRKRCRSA